MAHIIADRVKETTTTTGTGPLALNGASPGFAAFSGKLSTGDTTWYAAVLGTQWEIGLGTLTAASTLARTTVLASSNGDAIVNFAAGTKEVFVSPPAGFLGAVLRGDAAVSYTAAQIAQLLANLRLNAAGAVAHRNRLRNGALAVNQRAVSGTVTLAAGAYGHDGWKAGSGGCTYTFSAAASGDVTLTISAGTLLQVVEGGLYLPEGGDYRLSWAGSAQGRVYQGSASGAYAASPVAVAGLTAGTNAVVEFGTGTLTRAQFEPGTAASPFERRDDELRRCERYLQLIMTSIRASSPGGSAFWENGVNWRVPMARTPDVTMVDAGGSGGTAVGIQLIPTDRYGGRNAMDTSGSGDGYVVNRKYLVSAEL